MTKSEVIQAVMQKYRDELCELMKEELSISQTPIIDIILKNKTLEQIREEQKRLPDIFRRKEELIQKMRQEAIQMENGQ